MGINRLFSRETAVLAAPAHKPFLKKKENFPLLSMEGTLLKRVASLFSTQPLCGGVPSAVYLNSIPISSYLQALSKSSFSKALLHLAYFISIPYIAFKPVIKTNITFSILFFLLKNNSIQNQCCHL